MILQANTSYNGYVFPCPFNGSKQFIKGQAHGLQNNPVVTVYGCQDAYSYSEPGGLCNADNGLD